MKNKSFLYLLAAISLFCLYCRTSPGTTAEDASANIIKGEVVEIQAGKDGYTAKMLTAEGQNYFATISRANLADPAQYRSATIGESLAVEGDAWEMEGEKHITVRVLH